MVFSVYIIVEKRVIDIYVDTLRCFLSTLLSTSKLCRKTMCLARKYPAGTPVRAAKKGHKSSAPEPEAPA
jgi:hypothetical protein